MCRACRKPAGARRRRGIPNGRALISIVGHVVLNISDPPGAEQRATHCIQPISPVLRVCDLLHGIPSVTCCMYTSIVD